MWVTRQDNLNQMPKTHKTPAPWPDRKVSCSRTPTKHRTWNSIWEKNTEWTGATTFRRLPPTRGVTFHPAPGQKETHSTQ